MLLQLFAAVVIVRDCVTPPLVLNVFVFVEFVIVVVNDTDDDDDVDDADENDNNDDDDKDACVFNIFVVIFSFVSVKGNFCCLYCCNFPILNTALVDVRSLNLVRVFYKNRKKRKFIENFVFILDGMSLLYRFPYFIDTTLDSFKYALN